MIDYKTHADFSIRPGAGPEFYPFSRQRIWRPVFPVLAGRVFLIQGF
jgi:hypothetical protein